MPTIQDIKPALLIAKIPIIGLLILELFWYSAEMMPFLSFFTGDFLYLVKYGLLFWIGYKLVQSSVFDIKIVVAVGALTGLAVQILNLIFSLSSYSGSYGFGYWIGDSIKWVIIASALVTLGHFVTLKFFNKASGGDGGEEVMEDIAQERAVGEELIAGQCQADCKFQLVQRPGGKQYYKCVSDPKGDPPCPPANDKDCKCKIYRAERPKEGAPKYEEYTPDTPYGVPSKEYKDKKYFWRCWCTK
jgi:hypothetical protein